MFRFGAGFKRKLEGPLPFLKVLLTYDKICYRKQGGADIWGGDGCCRSMNCWLEPWVQRSKRAQECLG